MGPAEVKDICDAVGLGYLQITNKKGVGITFF